MHKLLNRLFQCNEWPKKTLMFHKKNQWPQQYLLLKQNKAKTVSRLFLRLFDISQHCCKLLHMTC